jgi:hypothetical protein
VGHGIGWKGDVKNIALLIDKIKKFGFKPRFTSAEAVRKTALMHIDASQRWINFRVRETN